MAVLLNEQFKNDLRKMFGLAEDELSDIADEVEQDDSTPDETPPEGEEDPTADESDPTDDATDDITDPTADEVDPASDPASDPVSDEPEAEIVPGTGDEVTSEATDDNGKVQSMFTDIGNPETDYGFTNPNNIRLAKFRFKKAGIDINQVMTETEKNIGLSTDKIIFRLTPEQYESYKERGHKIRNKFELIEKREKNIILFNSRIPIYFKDEKTNEIKKVEETDSQMLKKSFEKIDEFVTSRFGEDWVDNLNAIDFIQGIKVNFAETESITPNMITAKFFENDGEKLIPFNKLFVKMPKSVEDFVRENKDNQNFLRSSVYRTLAAGYIDGATDSNGVYAILQGDVQEDGMGDGADAGTEDQDPTDQPETDIGDIPLDTPNDQENIDSFGDDQV